MNSQKKGILTYSKTVSDCHLQYTLLFKIFSRITDYVCCIYIYLEYAFLQNLYQNDWDTIKTHQDVNEAYNNFILTFCIICDTFFPMNKMKIKTKDLESTWITKRIKKSKKKQF